MPSRNSLERRAARTFIRPKIKAPAGRAQFLKENLAKLQAYYHAHDSTLDKSQRARRNHSAAWIKLGIRQAQGHPITGTRGAENPKSEQFVIEHAFKCAQETDELLATFEAERIAKRGR